MTEELDRKAHTWLKALRGDDSMCRALLEIMEPEISEIKKNERIMVSIEVFKDLGRCKEEILSYLKEKYNMQEAEAVSYL